MTTRGATTGPLVHGLATRPVAGEYQSGDRAIVTPFEGGVLVAVIDGLGHGPDAAEAADVAAEVLNAHAGEPPTQLLRRCHDALRSTRGAAISLAAINTARKLEWVAVGNVQGIVAHESGATTRLVTRGGVVGRRLPPLRAATVPLAGNDLFVFFTDGVDEDVARDLPHSGVPGTLAAELFQKHAKATDDALILVARYLRRRP